MDLFSRQLRARARELGFTDAEVARRDGLQEARYNHYVTGRREPDLQTLVRICQVLNTKPNMLLGFDKDIEPASKRALMESRLQGSGAELSDTNIELAIEQIELLLKHQRQ